MKKLLMAALILLSWCWLANAQTANFTYQGRLTDGGTPANGGYDLQFALFDAASGGAQIGATQTVTGVVVSNGIFTVTLDFGANAFSGANRWLEINVRPAGGGAFTTLNPRQPVTPTPYAIKALNASQLNGIAANQYVLTSDARLSDARPPTAGRANYIQNGTSVQAASNFNITGNGTAGGTLSSNTVNATTQYNLGGSRIISGPGSNLFVGRDAGATGPTGVDNTYVGFNAGNASTTGDANSFFGVSAGFNNQASGNSFFGRSAGFSNTVGESNSFFGVQAGRDNCSACDLSFGQGSNNSFFGRSAGQGNTIGKTILSLAKARGRITREVHTIPYSATRPVAGTRCPTTMRSSAQMQVRITVAPQIPSSEL